MNPETEARKARQREEGKVAMAEYRQNQHDTLKRMAELRAQRLVRENCPHCSEEYEPTEGEAVAMKIPFEKLKPYRFRRGKGCLHCRDTGYLGRIGVYEIMYFSETLKRMLLDGASAVDLRAQAIREGMVTMMKDGMLKVREGITTPSEVLKNAYSPEESF